MNFTKFIGNEKVKEQLSVLTASGRLPHAIVLEGDTGLGKRTLARELAQGLLCRSEGERPCRACAQCSKAEKGIHPDIYEYTAEGGARSFHVEVIREVREDVFVQPNEGAYKIYILGNCQCMSDSAQNALLKILEEPPAYALFLLTVTNKSALLPTVLSRSVVLTLEGVSPQAAAEYICAQNETFDVSEVEQAATVWGGNIGKTLESLLDGKLSQISDAACALAEAMLADNEYDLLVACAVFERNRELLVATLALLKTMLRDALLYSPSSEILSGQTAQVKLLSSRLGRAKLLRLMDACEEIRTAAEHNGNNALLITKVCYALRRAQHR